MRRPRLLLLAAFLVGCASPPPPPAESPTAAVPLPSAVLEPGAAVESAVSIAFNEGPAAHADGSVYFSEVDGNRILKALPDGSWSVFRDPSGRANGLSFDPQGRLVACEGANTGGNRRVTRTDLKTGKVEVLAETFEGKLLNSPNDLDIALNGNIYFSDPRYVGNEARELASEDVYLIRSNGDLVRAATQPDIAKPNGIAISPDQKTLYVADTQPGPPREARVVAFDIADDGSLSNPRTHYSFGAGRGIDGMAVDVDGNLYGAAGSNTGPPENRAGVYVISPAGELLGRIPIPEDAVTNCAFGGPGLKTLYVTAGKQLFRIKTSVQGFVAYPKP
ncbi:MAG: SMP-30/gluconolactonase/LRE family protein [Acidobacteria bacterium]|nr:SMP-30/gluconolactonase/LRE family protein [Acidobacteriota bacterium]